MCSQSAVSVGLHTSKNTFTWNEAKSCFLVECLQLRRYRFEALDLAKEMNLGHFHSTSTLLQFEEYGVIILVL